jgi:DNA polymerase III delta subunit
MCFQRAERFSMADLKSHMDGLFDADSRLKSSGGQPVLVMEKLILRMCLGRQRKSQPSQARTGL